MDLTPDGLRYARAFWPTFQQRRKNLKLRIGKPFLDGLRRQANWPFDGPTPFEAERVIDPVPAASPAASSAPPGITPAAGGP